jgi:hypothetical protein
MGGDACDRKSMENSRFSNGSNLDGFVATLLYNHM